MKITLQQISKDMMPTESKKQMDLSMMELPIPMIK